MTKKVFKRRVGDLAINDRVDLASCPYLCNSPIAGNIYGVVTHKDHETQETVVIGYEGIDHIGYPKDTVLTVVPEPIYLFPHELVECDLGHESLYIRFVDRTSGVVIGDLTMDPTGRETVGPEAYGLTDADVIALNRLNVAIDEAVETALDAMAKAVQDHLQIATGDFAGLYFSGERKRRKLKKTAIRYALAEIKALRAELVDSEEAGQ